MLNDPIHRFLSLPTAFIEHLMKVTFSMEKCNCNPRYLEIGSRANPISCENAEATAVGGHGWDLDLRR